MRGRRAALLATTLTIGLLSGGVATASESPDDVAGVGATHTAPPATERALGTAPEAEADAGLEAALSGGAAAALSQFNQLRAAAGQRPLRADAELTAMAQTWATKLATERDLYLDPDLGVSKELPGYPVPGSLFIEYASGGYNNPTVSDLVRWAYEDEPGSILDDEAHPNHIGIGYSVNGYGEAFLYWISVQYDFNDIGPGDDFYDAVDFLYYWDIATGYPDGGFHPTGNVTREAMAAFMFRFLNNGDPEPTCDPAVERTFSDVTAGNPFCGHIEWLAAEGYAAGYPDGTYRPSAKVTRQAMAAFLYRAIEEPTLPACDAGPRTFTDVAASNTFCGAIEWMSDTGLSTGWPDHTFRPTLLVSRQATAAFFYRLAI